jgi:hypothetical protein
MYVLIHKNRVVVGPMLWNRAMFAVGLERLGINGVVLSRLEPTTPMTIDENTRIAYSRYEYPEYNTKTQYLHGPFWNFSEDIAVGTFEIKEKSVDIIKSELKQAVSNERYTLEVAGAKVTFNDTEYSVSTERTARDIFVQKYVSLGDSDTVNWKFPEGFVTLSKTQLGQVIQAINTKVQEAFDWEYSKHQEIDAATTAEQLNDIVLTQQQAE